MAGLQGSTAQLQGGTGISLGNFNPQQTSTFQVQQPTGIPLQGTQNAVNQGAAYVNNAQSQYSGLQSQISNLLAQIKAQQAAYAPSLNLNSIYANAANSSGVKATNQYYSKQLQQFQAQQSADKVIHQQQAQTDIQNLQDQLTNTLQANQVSQARTGQDVLQNEQQIGIKADQQQQDQGTQFDQARIAQAKQLATQGLTTSGAGAQQVLQSQTDRNTQESRQAADTQQQVQAQELLKNRTFEDLANSGALAKQSESKGVKQTNFDLNNYIAQQGRDLTTQTQNLEKQRLGDVATQQRQAAQIAVNNFIQSIANPAQRQAAAQAYGGAFA